MPGGSQPIFDYSS